MLLSKRVFAINVINLCLCTPLFASQNHVSFAPAEHVTAGDQVSISFAPHTPGQKAYVFQLPSGLQASYGDLVTFGDYYGVAKEPIAFGKSADDRKKRFRVAFDMFAINSATNAEAKQIIDIVRHEQQVLVDRMAKGEKPEHIYAEIGDETTRQLNCATGGGCSSIWWLEPGRLVSLSMNNYDHFGKNLWLAYKAGHDAAIDEALAAHQTGDRKQLELAYAMNAFAGHFLSDQFSSGHLRVPRTELPDHTTPSVVGHALANYMHNEESAHALHVHNAQGEHWIAFGDESYFNHQNKENRDRLQAALQLSADQIFSAYEQGVAPNDEAVYALIPDVDEKENKSNQDISALFYWDGAAKTLLRRQTIANPFDRHWTSHWWGWSTLVDIVDADGLPPEIQAQFALSRYAEKAIADGIITNKDVLNHYYATQRHKGE